MNKLTIFTDSCSDLTKKEIDVLGVKIIPIYYYFNDKDVEYGDVINITMKEFFEKIEHGYIPRTAACSIDMIYNEFKKEIENGNDIICINISSKLSSTYNNCVIASNLIKEEYPNSNIHVVDSLSGSMGQRLMIQDIINKNYEDAVNYLESKKEYYHIEFFVNDLTYLLRGGRLSKTSCIIGKTLNIKPLVGVNIDGEASAILKVKGEKRLLNTLIDRMINNIGDNNLIGVVHSNCLDKAEMLREKIKELNIAKEILLSEISPTIASHIGPNAVGLSYKLKYPKTKF